MTIIIGAGLSGLLIGYRLKKEGIPFKILEARNRIGGRINTLYGKNHTPIEMGATWFTDQHKNIIALLKELKIDYFEQYMDSTVFFQNSPNSPIQTIKIPSQSPSYRISGGTSKLINRLFQEIDKGDVLLNQTVKDIKFRENSVQVIAKDVFEGQQVILANSPKLWANKIVFKPELPTSLLNTAKQTHTWMEDSIKIALTYDAPFWQDQNLPSTLFSNTGPITELYDHCNSERSKYALCGFINSSFKKLSNKERQGQVINQLKIVFGAKAEDFLDYEECVWSMEDNTFEGSDIDLYPHQNNGNPIFSEPYFDGKLLISCAESASKFPGYMEGAVYSANITARQIRKGLH